MINGYDSRFVLWYLIKDLYWRNIPYKCRCCDYVKSCRTGWREGRKCHDGCLILNYKREYLMHWDREDYLDNLLDYVERQTGNEKK